MTYVKKRTNMEFEFARNLLFQSIYCTALDQDLDMCGLIQQTCGFRELKHMHDSAMNLRRGQYVQWEQKYGAKRLSGSRCRAPRLGPWGRTRLASGRGSRRRPS